jgi:hypothetical protein
MTSINNKVLNIKDAIPFLQIIALQNNLKLYKVNNFKKAYKLLYEHMFKN